jgi:predicted nucleic-acid-binding protein
MKAFHLDTNVLLRFLTHDDPAQWPAAEALVLRAQRGAVELWLDPVVVNELTCALDLHYQRGRGEIAETLLALVRSPGLRTAEPAVLVDALARYREKPVDFADALLAARSRADGHPVASFDRDLDRFKDITRYEPRA